MKNSSRKYDVIIIGGGAVGCAIAYVLSQYDIRIALLEREIDVCMATSGKNSAVVHAGFNNKPGSLMAQLCVQGNLLFEDICSMLNVPYRKTGKLVIGFNNEDMDIIDKIINDGARNGCIGLTKIDQEHLQELEPLVTGIGALYSKNTAVINPFLYTIHLAEVAVENNVDIFLSHEVTEIKNQAGGFIINAGGAIFECEIVINSAGLYADKVSAMAGDCSFQLHPCRGEYYIMDKQATDLISRPIYPVPRTGLGGLGVHLTTSIDHNLLLGPSAQYVESCEDYATTAATLEQLFREATTLLPSLKRDWIIGSYTGIRPKLVAKGQSNFGDFIIEESKIVPNLINLIGIESPGLTASIPIAHYVYDIIKKKHGALTQILNYQPRHTGIPLFRNLSEELQNRAILENSDYGEVICRCELVTLADIKNALHNTLGTHSIVSLKNRLRSTMGRCQGGYCLSKIAYILETELNQKPEDIVLRKLGDAPFQGRVK